MTIIEGLVDYLGDVAGITALVSTRIRATQADENDAMPYILLDLVSDPSVYAMSGEAGLSQSRVQARCVGATPKSALDVSEAVRNGISAYRGAMGTVQVRRCHKTSRRGPEFSQPQDGSQIGKYMVLVDFSIDYHE